MHRHITIAALVAASVLGGAGCEATLVPPQPVVTIGGGLAVRVNTVPADVRWAPRVRFGEGYAYLVDGVWYQWTPGGWLVYRREPTELWRERRRIFAAPRRRPLPPPSLAFPPR